MAKFTKEQKDVLRAAVHHAISNYDMEDALTNTILAELTAHTLRPNQPVRYEWHGDNYVTTDGACVPPNATKVRALFTEDEVMGCVGRAMIHAGVSYDTGRIAQLETQLDDERRAARMYGETAEHAVARLTTAEMLLRRWIDGCENEWSWLPISDTRAFLNPQEADSD